MCLPRASIVITSTVRGKYELEKAFGLFSENIKIINYPVTINTQLSCVDDWNFPFEKKSYLFYPAQFWPHKNHIVIIKALKKLKDQGKFLNLIFTGSDKGNQTYILNSTIKFGVEENVQFLGYVSEEKIKILYKNAIALTYASLMGPSNLPPIEALFMNCPVICADTPGMREQLGESALYFDGTSAEQLAEKIMLIMDPNVSDELLGYSKEILKNYTVDKYIEKIIKEIDEFALIRECW
jgi:glycosyltransferase involved in cell wall biosynthesis